MRKSIFVILSLFVISILAAGCFYSGTGTTDPTQADSDGDGILDADELCPGFDDYEHTDTDGIPDGCDNCVSVDNPDQSDLDGDGIGDDCDTDADNDGIMDADEIEITHAIIYTLADFYDMFLDANGNFQGIIVHTEGSSDDKDAANLIAGSMLLNGAPVVPADGVVSDGIVVDYAGNIIAIGDICESNAFLYLAPVDCETAYADMETQYSFDSNTQAVIALYESAAGHNYIIITGRDPAMRIKAAETISEYATTPMSWQFMVVS